MVSTDSRALKSDPAGALTERQKTRRGTKEENDRGRRERMTSGDGGREFIWGMGTIRTQARQL